MKKYLLYTALALMLFSSSSMAQRWRIARLEISGGLTTLNYFGDIGGSASSSNFMGLGDISLSSTRPWCSVPFGRAILFARDIQFWFYHPIGYWI